MTSRSLFSTFATGQTRTLLGPLTTTFTAPATCTLPVQQCTTCAIAWQGQDCYSSSADIRVRDNTQCWPAASGSIATQSASLPLKGWGFYSPGLICPTGYTSACSATGMGASNYNFQYAILPSETVVGCCPTGYTCASEEVAQTCMSVAVATTLELQQCTSGLATLTAWTIPTLGYSFMTNFSTYTTSGTATLPTTTVSITLTTQSAEVFSSIVTTIEAYTLYAPLIQMNFQSTDLATPLQTSAPSSSASSSSSPTPSPSSNPDLSSGAKAGIGVGVTAIVMGIIFGAFLWWRRRRHRYTGTNLRSPTPAEMQGHSEHETHELQDTKGGEIMGNPIYELTDAEGQKWAHEIHELPDGQGAMMVTPLSGG